MEESGNESVSLQEVFKNFAGGKNEMSTKDFAKLNKECGLLDKKYTTTDVDINFTKVKDKTSKVITFHQFEEALKLAAKKKGISYDELVQNVCKHKGPVFHGTKTDNVKLHDDKSTYTGVYAKGGPSTVDSKSGKVSDISHLCDRTGADVRGVKK
jgi:hypothetical protein